MLSVIDIPNSKSCENVLTRLARLQGNERHAIDLHLVTECPEIVHPILGLFSL